MAQSAEEMKEEIIETLTKVEIDEVTVMLNKFKMMHINTRWDFNKTTSCRAINFDISCFSPKQQLYTVNLGYKILRTWDPMDLEFKYTLHLY